jgi:hypothetical protein
VGRLPALTGGGPASPRDGVGGESHGSQAPGTAGLPKHLPAGRQERNFAKPVVCILATGFLLMEPRIFKGGKEK